MSLILHLITQPQDALAAEVIRIQQGQSGNEVQTIQLTEGSIDYDALVESVFKADSVQVW